DGWESCATCNVTYGTNLGVDSEGNIYPTYSATPISYRAKVSYSGSIPPPVDSGQLNIEVVKAYPPSQMDPIADFNVNISAPVNDFPTSRDTNASGEITLSALEAADYTANALEPGYVVYDPNPETRAINNNTESITFIALDREQMEQCIDDVEEATAITDYTVAVRVFVDGSEITGQYPIYANTGSGFRLVPSRTGAGFVILVDSAGASADFRIRGLKIRRQNISDNIGLTGLGNIWNIYTDPDIQLNVNIPEDLNRPLWDIVNMQTRTDSKSTMLIRDQNYTFRYYYFGERYEYNFSVDTNGSFTESNAHDFIYLDGNTIQLRTQEFETLVDSNLIGKKFYVRHNNSNVKSYTNDGSLWKFLLLENVDYNFLYSNFGKTIEEESPFSMNSSGEIVGNSIQSATIELPKRYVLEGTLVDVIFISSLQNKRFDVYFGARRLLSKNGDYSFRLPTNLTYQLRYNIGSTFVSQEFMTTKAVGSRMGELLFTPIAGVKTEGNNGIKFVGKDVSFQFSGDLYRKSFYVKSGNRNFSKWTNGDAQITLMPGLTYTVYQNLGEPYVESICVLDELTFDCSPSDDLNDLIYNFPKENVEVSFGPSSILKKFYIKRGNYTVNPWKTGDNSVELVPNQIYTIVSDQKSGPHEEATFEINGSSVTMTPIVSWIDTSGGGLHLLK
ncbi:hypothetical protein MJH12_11500, partial [bacterium]|nr:hypothetical protein [bacterium]